MARSQKELKAAIKLEERRVRNAKALLKDTDLIERGEPVDLAPILERIVSRGEEQLLRLKAELQSLGSTPQAHIDTIAEDRPPKKEEDT